MTERARREYAAVLRAQYRLADKQERGRILDVYCRTTRCHRKSAIRCLGRAPSGSGRRPGRPARFGRECLPILERLWQASDYLSGKLLAAVLPTLLAALETHHGLVVAPPVRTALLAASPATLDHLLRPLRRRRPRVPRRVAPALSAVRRQVPLRTWREWHDATPGTLLGDLVLHCGETSAGFYCTTLVAVDVATSWTELQAIWGLHQQRVTGGIQALAQRLPFPCTTGTVTTSASSSITACSAGVTAARSASPAAGPYRKNDQALVEQRNGLLVHRLVGYDRYSSRAACAVLQRLYGLLRLQHNFFRPVRKLLSKRRVGATVLKRYDAARTPYQRVLATGVLTPAQHDALAGEVHALDPIQLARDIQHTLEVPGLEVLAKSGHA